MTDPLLQMDLITPQMFYVVSETRRLQQGPLAPIALTTPATPSQQPNIPPSTQPRLRKPKRDDWQKADAILATITKDFRSLGHFLEVVFYNHISGVPDPRTTRHVCVVTAFLGGETNVTMATIIDLIYNHRQSPVHSGIFSATIRCIVARPRSVCHLRPQDGAMGRVHKVVSWKLTSVDVFNGTRAFLKRMLI
ncbi:hypothetical protein B0H17DRAFT_1151727 [Mycena rosella]|uniref:Uncharacterized protein n=1 Tax=Mycena rosella TaxID=1033263 RepID=A0AAD7FJ29_MYCRO|nr:hypothetical protein B0H17DRAFT_1151727 [Mycena rosella]